MPLSTHTTTPAPPAPVGIRDIALRLTMSFAPHARRVEQTRRAAGALLRQGDMGDEAVETVQLLISEIVTNAVVHGGGDRVRFSLSYDQLDTVRIEVDDRSPARVAVRRAGVDEESGRGMFLVDTLARSWGRRGTRTWCTVAVNAAREVPTA
ncbi:ATP-binding protein [Streptomyces sp. NPDC093109]|uniref:ATP-binding protein n=1 Tax=Streptomyces sp. NPDC093109 TaxID=3154977 RepID=UPI00344DFD92